MRNLFSTAAYATDTAIATAKPVTTDAKPGRAIKPVSTAKPGNTDAAKPVTTDAAKPGNTDAAKSDNTDAAKPVRDIAAERKTARELHASFEAQRLSVPIKTTAAFKPVAVAAHPIARKPSMRQAAAIAVAYRAANAKLTDGATASRQFKLAENEHAVFCIENGAMRDAIASGLLTVSGDAGNETLRLAPGAAKAIAGLLGESKLKQFGLLA